MGAMMLPLMLLAPQLISTLGNVLNPGAGTAGAGSAGINPLMLMMMMGKGGMSANNMLPLMLMGGMGGTGGSMLPSDPMTQMVLMQTMSKKSGGYRRRRGSRSMAARMAYQAGAISVLRGLVARP